MYVLVVTLQDFQIGGGGGCTKDDVCTVHIIVQIPLWSGLVLSSMVLDALSFYLNRILKDSDYKMGFEI